MTNPTHDVEIQGHVAVAPTQEPDVPDVISDVTEREVSDLRHAIRTTNNKRMRGVADDGGSMTPLRTKMLAAAQGMELGKWHNALIYDKAMSRLPVLEHKAIVSLALGGKIRILEVWGTHPDTPHSSTHYRLAATVVDAGLPPPTATPRPTLPSPRSVFCRHCTCSACAPAREMASASEKQAGEPPTEPVRLTCRRPYETHNVSGYRVDFFHGEDDGIVVEVPAILGCITQGKDREEALANAAEAIAVSIEPPGPEVVAVIEEGEVTYSAVERNDARAEVEEGCPT